MMIDYFGIATAFGLTMTPQQVNWLIGAIKSPNKNPTTKFPKMISPPVYWAGLIAIYLGVLSDYF